MKKMNQLKLKKLDDRARPLKKAYDRPSGIDISIIDVADIGNGYIGFRTGWAVEIPEGYHIKLVPRSSITKYGWMMSNSIGIIDEDYRGEIIIRLTPTAYHLKMLEFIYHDNSANILNTAAEHLSCQLPLSLCQIMLEKTELVEIVEVDELSDSKRGSGAFGSSNK